MGKCVTKWKLEGPHEPAAHLVQCFGSTTDFKEFFFFFKHFLPSSLPYFLPPTHSLTPHLSLACWFYNLNQAQLWVMSAVTSAFPLNMLGLRKYLELE